MLRTIYKLMKGKTMEELLKLLRRFVEAQERLATAYEVTTGVTAEEIHATMPGIPAGNPLTPDASNLTQLPPAPPAGPVRDYEEITETKDLKSLCIERGIEVPKGTKGPTLRVKLIKFDAAMAASAGTSNAGPQTGAPLANPFAPNAGAPQTANPFAGGGTPPPVYTKEDAENAALDFYNRMGATPEALTLTQSLMVSSTGQQRVLDMDVPAYGLFINALTNYQG